MCSKVWGLSWLFSHVNFVLSLRDQLKLWGSFFPEQLNCGFCLWGERNINCGKGKIRPLFLTNKKLPRCDLSLQRLMYRTVNDELVIEFFPKWGKLKPQLKRLERRKRKTSSARSRLHVTWQVGSIKSRDNDFYLGRHRQQTEEWHSEKQL